MPLPPLEIWATSTDCLAWLGQHGVQAVRFSRRALPRLPDDPAPGDVSGPADKAPALFQPSHRRRAWRQQCSVGVEPSEWPRSPADEMLCRLDGVVAVGPRRQAQQAASHIGAWVESKCYGRGQLTWHGTLCEVVDMCFGSRTPLHSCQNAPAEPATSRCGASKDGSTCRQVQLPAFCS